MNCGSGRHSHRRKNTARAIAKGVTHHKADVVFSGLQLELSAISQAIMLYLLQAFGLQMHINALGKIGRNFTTGAFGNPNDVNDHMVLICFIYSCEIGRHHKFELDFGFAGRFRRFPA